MIIIVLTLIITALIVWKMYTIKFRNPYTLTLIYGKKGCGKSTIAQKIIWQHWRRGWNVYCNIGDSRMKYCEEIDASRLWEQQIKEHSLVVIDEVNLLWDNREFKTFPKELGQWFRLQRHYKIKVILFSQTADADKKIRDLTDRVYLCRRFMDVLIYCIPYEKDIVYKEPDKAFDASGFMDVYKKLSFGPFGCMFCYLPKWIKTHDSFKDIKGKGRSEDAEPRKVSSSLSRLDKKKQMVRKSPRSVV